MMSQSRLETYEMYSDVERGSRCIGFLRLLWKFLRCVFSHVILISLVIAYCLIGAYAFESLEADHEKQVKKNIKYLRGNVTEKLWRITKEVEVLIRENWTEDALRELQGFENNLFTLLRKEGWDGSEEENTIQWTFAGALFYSIIVITTIGYGHIAPKTKNGKVVTIFYAVLGIPLMLLCLSNIGDVMATSFRFLYWKVCCYVCTKPPKKKRTRGLTRSHSARQSMRYESGRGASLRRSIRLSQRSKDPSLGFSENFLRSSYSDTECRNSPRRLNGMDQRNASSYVPSSSTNTYPKASTMSRNSNAPEVTLRSIRGNPKLMTQSLDRRLPSSSSNLDRSPVLCNKYALNDVDDNAFMWQPSTAPKYTENRLCTDDDGQSTMIGRPLPRRYHSIEGAFTNRAANVTQSFQTSAVHLKLDQPRKYQYERSRSVTNNYPSVRSYRRESQIPRTISSTGCSMQRQLYTDDIDIDYDRYTTAEEQERQPIKPVPIWLCVFLVVSYILGGAFLFSKWENWPFLDSAYFCFITLTTIGFGDFVPEYKQDDQKGIALCSLYLLFGIALLAMSFNLVQEEVISNVKTVAKRLGILKDSDDEYEDDDNDNYDAEYEDEVDDDILER